jgi:hypothetical protein
VRIFGVLSSPHAAARFFVTAFFAIAFLQSAIDKIVDREGNLGWLTGHFKNSPLAGMVPLMLSTLTALEMSAGLLCALGVLVTDFREGGWSIAALGLLFSTAALLALFFGQRIAKDYAGAAVIAAYFVAALVGLALF